MALTDGQRRVLAFLANYPIDLPEAIIKAGYSAKRLRQTVYQLKHNPEFMRCWAEKKDGKKDEPAPESKAPRPLLTGAEKIEKMRQLAETCETEGKYNDAEKYWRQYFELTHSFDEKQSNFGNLSDAQLDERIEELKAALLAEDRDSIRELLTKAKREISVSFVTPNVSHQAETLMEKVEEPPKVEDEPAPKPWQAGTSSFELPEVATPKPLITGGTTHCDLHGPFPSASKCQTCPRCQIIYDDQNAIEEKRMSSLTMPADFRGRY